MSIRRKFEESRTYYQDALDLAIETGSTWLTAGPLASLSQWKIANGNLQGAIDDYHHFEEVTSTVGDERELCFAQLALANLYERIGDSLLLQNDETVRVWSLYKIIGARIGNSKSAGKKPALQKYYIKLLCVGRVSYPTFLIMLDM